MIHIFRGAGLHSAWQVKNLPYSLCILLLASAGLAAAEPFRPEPGKFPPLEEAKPYSGELVFVDIDDPACADLAKSVGVVNIPWLSVFVNGQHHGQICGLREPDELASILNALVENSEPKRKWWHVW